MRNFDFLVLGASQSGTTSLWQGLDSHPQIRVPADKERGFFNSDDRYAKGVEWYVKWTFRHLTDRQVIGTVTPQLMPHDPAVLDKLVERIGETSPEVKLIAILRNPIERAVSHYRRGLRDGGVNPSDDFDAFVARRARERGLERVPVVAVGQYGRILSRYLEVFDREQFLLLFTEDLDKQPESLYRRVFEYLGVDPGHRPRLARVNVGGTAHRVSVDALDELTTQLERTVWPLIDDPEPKRGFTWWLRHIWNIEPDEMGKDVGDKLRSELAEVFLTDGRILEEAFGVTPPWIDSLEAARRTGITS